MTHTVGTGGKDTVQSSLLFLEIKLQWNFSTVFLLLKLVLVGSVVCNQEFYLKRLMFNFQRLSSSTKYSMSDGIQISQLEDYKLLNMMGAKASKPIAVRGSVPQERRFCCLLTCNVFMDFVEKI